MSLFSVLGSAGFANFGYGLGGLGSLAGLYMMNRDNKKSRSAVRRMRAEELREREAARRYDTPTEQARRFREAGFQPNRLSPGAYGPIVTNTSGDVSPVGSPMFDMLERFGNTYNVLRSIRQSEMDNEFRAVQSDNQNYHAQVDRMIKLKELDLKTRQFIEDTAHGKAKMKMLEDQHKDMLKLKTDILEETKNYHEAMTNIANKNSDRNTYRGLVKEALNSAKYFMGF